MKTWKKITSLAIALMCVVSLSACNKADDSDKDAKKDTKAETKVETAEGKATKTVESFMDAFCEFDFTEAANYIDEMPEDLEGMQLDAMIDAMMDEMPAEMEPYADDFESMLNGLMDRCLATFEYEITDTEEKDGNYEFTLEVTIPDMDGVDIESIIADSFSEDAMMTILQDALTSGELSETSTEQEAMDYLMDQLIPMLGDVIADIEIETSTEEITLVVVEDDGEWIISAEESDLN